MRFVTDRGPATPDGSPRTALRRAALALATGLAAFAVGIVAESAIIHAVHGTRRQLEWVSDALISTALAGIAYLWLHLRGSRIRVLALEQERIAVNEQLRLAAEIQRGLLPDVPLATPGFRWAARMIPASRIGGDFYDFIQPATGIVVAIVGDVSGKGIPAALLQSSLKTLFRTLARESVDPAAIAEGISAALDEEYEGLPYATAIVARFETAPPRLAYVNAGHPAGYLLRNGAVAALLESGGRPLGLLPGPEYRTVNVELSPGDVGVLVTDGITEALEAGPQTLPRLLGAPAASLAAGRSPADLADNLLRAAAAGAGPVGVADWQDDRTVLVFAVTADA